MAANSKDVDGSRQTRVEGIINGFVRGNKEEENKCLKSLEEAAKDLETEWAQLYKTYLENDVSYLNEQEMALMFNNTLGNIKEIYLNRKVEKIIDKHTKKIIRVAQPILDYGNQLLELERKIFEFKEKLVINGELKKKHSNVVSIDVATVDMAEIKTEVEAKKFGMADDIESLKLDNEELIKQIEKAKEKERELEEKIRLKEKNKLLLQQFQMSKERNKNLKQQLENPDSDASNDPTNTDNSEKDKPKAS